MTNGVSLRAVGVTTEMIGNRKGNQIWPTSGMMRSETATELELYGGGDGTRTHEPLDCQL